MHDFPGHKTDILQIMANIKFADGAYFVDKSVEHITSRDICSALAGNINPNEDISSQIPGLPGAIARDLFRSDIRIVVIKHKDLAIRLEDFREVILETHEEALSKLSEEDYKNFLNSMNKDIQDTRKESILGCFYSGDSLVNKLFEAPTIVLYDLEEPYVGTNKNSNVMHMASTLQHEAGHAIDYINGKKEKYASFTPHFHWVFEEKYLKNTPETAFLYHVADINFLEHCKHYKKAEKPFEVVAEVISKYCHTYNMHPQIAEVVTNHDFPYIWPEIKNIVPQIKDSLVSQGYNENARPLYSNPYIYIF